MGTIVTLWSEVVAVYPELGTLKQAAGTEGQVAMIARAEAYVHGRMASNFTTPFSSNNYTAKDLVFDALYVQNVLSRQPIKGKTMTTFLDDKIKALLGGSMQMVDINGTLCHMATGDPVWSSTQNYHPTFGMGNEIVFAVSSDMLIDENATRNLPVDEAY